MSQRVLLLREPLRELKYGQSQSVYVADSLDYTQRQAYTIGSGAYELTGRIRFADNPQTLIDLIKAGAATKTIVYYPNLSDPGVSYSCLLIKPIVPTVLKQDPNTGLIFGDQDVEIVLRKTDQTPFQASQQNILLFSFRAGDRIQEATYSRVGTARYASNVGGGGYGRVSTATTNIARLHWMSTKSSAGPRNVPTLLLEGARTNLILQSANLKKTTVWTANTLTITSGQADPSGGSVAFKLLDASTTVIGNLTQTNITIAAATRATLSWFLKAGTGNVKSWVTLRSTNGASTFIRGTVTWSSGIPTFGTSAKGQLIGPADRWSCGFYRQAFRTTGNLTTGKYATVIIPAATAAAAKGSIIAYGPQVEV